MKEAHSMAIKKKTSKKKQSKNPSKLSKAKKNLPAERLNSGDQRIGDILAWIYENEPLGLVRLRRSLLF